MEVIEHFSHKHPLSFFELDDIEEEKPYLCSICGLPILCSPSYTCTTHGCQFFLHKACANLPKKLYKSKHHPSDNHVYMWLGRVGDSYRQGKLRQTFIYICFICKFEIHPLVAAPVEIKVKHKSHPSHPLVAICNQISCRCDACGETQDGFFFFCGECNFWIHQDCTLLPNILKLASDPYPYMLTYQVADMEFTEARKCKLCKEKVFRQMGLYYCAESSDCAHVSCARSNLDQNLKTEARLDSIHLPDEEGDTFPSLVIRRYLESNQIPHHHNNKDNNMLAFGEYHNHPLVFHDHHGISSSNNNNNNNNSSNREESCDLVCDVCIQPINISSPSSYRCIQPNCHFLVHNICANLPSLRSHHIGTEKFTSPVSAYLDLSKIFFNSIFPCFCCGRPCNGFFCYFLTPNRSVHLFMDLECAVAPKTMKHTSHRQHVLVKMVSRGEMNCCSVSLDHWTYSYKCISCPFEIDMGCAMLPKRTRHKFDEHSLELVTHTSYHHHSIEDGCCVCEVCEKDIDQRYWYYGCGECDQYFHTNCIPSVGYLSKVKFGKTLVDYNIHPKHPLTLTRMLTYGRNERCGYCNQIIKGFVDEMAFHCSECDFWIHFSCAWDSSADHETSNLKVYWEGISTHQFLTEIP